MIALSLVRVIERHSNELAVKWLSWSRNSEPPRSPPICGKSRSRNCGDESKKSSAT
jgi:hypothetical protein